MGRGTQGLNENGTLEFQVWVEGLAFWQQLRAMFVSAAAAHSRASGRFLSSLRNSWHLTSSIASRRSAGWGRGQAGLCSKNLEFLNFFFKVPGGSGIGIVGGARSRLLGASAPPRAGLIRVDLAKSRNARPAACAPVKLVSALLARPHAFSFRAGILSVG